ncbi:hypothetical protein DSCO28_44120 [Desulfosarcina ovata subsp. sediminis]|uniref:Uncharacterized protein n=1 Tax=Desulfosarcina ovata subsp. sediminis TaxID=885957 RepID=A0A5K7ZUE4_9BACT|nr:DUF6765 family protein [Desulfosarcina ovata]BBO83846.1 hypothetical protein DSCO28_44120 [Desulfosarcina ovata subsp. sediminis]
MQIDFHHATTYVAARLAGFDPADADIIAYAAQYVDDATSAGAIHFDNKAMYQRISSAHKMLDKRNAEALANHLVWIPFHFLPGNAGMAADQNPDGAFIEKIICTPDSPIAREMVRQAIVEKEKPYGLQRLGVAMHVYADTWAHQGFAGVLHPVNEVENAKETGKSGGFSKKLSTILNDFLDDAIPPLGHGRALTFPDMPFLKWRYKNYQGAEIVRDNTALFCEAANHLCMAMQRYIAGDADADVPGMDAGDRQKIEDLFLSTTKDDGEKRHAVWIKAIKSGAFSFGGETIAYAGKGKGSWKEQALGTNFDLPVHTFKEKFMQSNWKRFHDAVQAHRLHVVHDLLPKYGICAA